MSTETKLKRGQLILAQIPQYHESLALGVIEGVKKEGGGFVVRILVPNEIDANPCDIAGDDVMPASVGDVCLSYRDEPMPFKITEVDNGCFYEELSRHERGQLREMAAVRYFCMDLPADVAIPVAIKALVAAGHRFEATELLFGCRRDTYGHKLQEGLFGWTLYLQLLAGSRIPEPGTVIGEIADNHRWVGAKEIPNGGLPIEVFDGEYLLIDEPLATRLINLLVKM